MGNNTEVGKGLWDVGDELRANLKFKSSESSGPMVGLTFLRYADQRKDRSREFMIQDRTPFAMVGAGGLGHTALLPCEELQWLG